MKFKQIIFSLFCALLVPLVAWVGGMNFDERSVSAAIALSAAIYIFGISFFLLSLEHVK